jgi:exodeoxyribonuclease VII small subunit
MRYGDETTSNQQPETINSYMSKKEFSFNDAVTEIEKILHNIESGDLDIDKLSVEVKRASELIKECQKKLKVTEEEINSIFKDLV